MKKIIFAVLLIVPVALFAQVNYVVKGKIGDLGAPATIFLSYGPMGKIVRDSVLLRNGRFEFRGRIEAPAKASLLLRHQPVRPGDRSPRDIRSIYLEDGIIEVTAPDSVSKAIVRGSALNDDYRALTEMLVAVRITESKGREAGRSAGEVRLEQDSMIFNFIQAHANSPVSLEALQSYFFPIAGDVAVIEPMFQMLSPELRVIPAGKEMGAAIAQLKKTAVGVMAPGFSLTDPDGRPVNLSDFRGKYVLLDFWASWCHPCRAENPGLLKAYNEYKGRNFTILGITMDRSHDAWVKAIREDSLPWTQAGDLKSSQPAVADLYSINAIPQNFLIDPDGRIIARNLREEQLRAKLHQVMPF